ncbi:endonuclease/exonuclease/phosphatase family protein [Streptomyces sp. NA04227]|uniref:endonuclease/exonuclease/phosphatase family protein n=1 Tax=Streptomyces sp. NA04227 TaxID=2742136 RepID=UPI001590AD16|nr:endonuclease/exonuclease/phosphatase family protein [Streptomyces sp. NA04227]QKW06925.1 endonuclease/exonuclease/phosphatase family protein [Streptomyces sp. NA04227]
MHSVLRVVTFNTLFGGHSDSGLGLAERWDGQVEFLRSLRADVLALQECNFWDLLGRRRLHRMVTALGMAQGFLAEANVTTAGHRFHSAILLSERVAVDAEDADRTRYHHVMGWANLTVPGMEGLVELRNLHLDPFDPRNRAREVAPLGILAAPGRRSLVVGDFNTVGLGFAEPDWSTLPPHLRNGHLHLPGQAESSDRDALELLARAGFVDTSSRFGQETAATAAFGDGDVPRRQDLILASPAMAAGLVRYQVHMEPVDMGLSDHAAVSADFDLGVLAQGA